MISLTEINMTSLLPHTNPKDVKDGLMIHNLISFFKSASVLSGWEGDNESLCAMIASLPPAVVA